jgi:hypothetical protein
LHGLGIGHKVSRAGGQMGGENRHGKPQSEKATLVDVDVNVNLVNLRPIDICGKKNTLNECFKYLIYINIIQKFKKR